MRLALGNGFASHCRFARFAIHFVLLGLAVVVVGIYFIAPFVVVSGNPRYSLPSYLLGSLAIWHPTLLYMCALWCLGLAAECLIQQETKAVFLSRHISQAGWLLMLGALAAAFTRPLLLGSTWFARLLVEHGLRYPVETARLFDQYVAAAVIGLVGLLLVLVSRVLREQSAATAELRQIF